MGNLCAYSNALGTPGQGFHAIRFGGFAVVDVLLTVGLALAIVTAIFRRGRLRGFGSYLAMVFSVFALLVVLAVGVHELFCVDTRLNALLFGRAWPENGGVGPPLAKQFVEERP